MASDRIDFDVEAVGAGGQRRMKSLGQKIAQSEGFPGSAYRLIGPHCLVCWNDD